MPVFSPATKHTRSPSSKFIGLSSRQATQIERNEVRGSGHRLLAGLPPQAPGGIVR
jgi:hypothetical protein